MKSTEDTAAVVGLDERAELDEGVKKSVFGAAEGVDGVVAGGAAGLDAGDHDYLAGDVLVRELRSAIVSGKVPFLLTKAPSVKS